MPTPAIYTVGHSTRSIQEFLDLLHTHGIRRLVDVRLIPFSRRNPQFNTENLEGTLERCGLQYRPIQPLGGRRKAQPDSPNLGWRNASFRGYADYMQTDPFLRALRELIAYAKSERTAIMCAEAVPWRCHRSLIADALVSRGWDVWHILSARNATSHEMTTFAQVIDGRLIYPKA
jgi:uncharacterized protein (DUF488 family)